MDGDTAEQVRVDDNDHTVIGTPAWIERDQYVYFVTMAHELGDPADWPRFRDRLVSALNAAWALDTVWAHLDRQAQQQRTAERHRLAFAIVDEVRARHDPVTGWDGFFDALWDARGPLCNDDPD